MVTQNMFLCYFTHQKCGGNSIKNFKSNHVNLILKFEVFSSNSNNLYSIVLKNIRKKLVFESKRIKI